MRYHKGNYLMAGYGAMPMSVAGLSSTFYHPALSLYLLESPRLS
jgi:hypothetical protein